MEINRRFFLKSALFASGALIGEKLIAKNLPDFALKSDAAPSFPHDIILPKALIPGSKIAVLSPASWTAASEVVRFQKLFKSFGFEVEVAESLKTSKKSFGYLSASDQVRAKEFNEYIKRDDIDCIFTSRGGYGAMRILQDIDYTALNSKPKIIIGFSDITALLNAVYRKSNIVTYHGPVAISGFGDFSMNYIKKTLFNSDKFTPIEFADKNLETFSKGKSVGKLVGGNLTMLVSTLGTEYEFNAKDSIIFIEETNEEPYKIDRMLTQLALAGKLKDCNGIILGSFKNADRIRKFFPRYSFKLREVFEQILLPLQKPVIMGFPIGHQYNQITMPLGVKAEMDADAKAFRIIEPSVAYV